MIYINDDGVGIGLIVIGLVYLVFGATLIFSAYKRQDDVRMQYPRWHHRRFMAYCFDFWLGLSLLMAVALVDLVLGYTILRMPGQVSVGWILFFIVATTASLAAAKHWARDNLPEVL